MTVPRQSVPNTDKYTEAALDRHKRAGAVLAVRARWAAMAVIMVMLPFVNPRIDVLYYEALCLCFVGMGWVQYRVARVGRSFAEGLVVLGDFALMTITVMVPNPFSPNDWPLAMEYRGELFKYFYVLLAGGTLAYSWRTVRWMGTLGALLWAGALGVVWLIADPEPTLSEAAQAAFGRGTEMAELLDPNNPLYFIRVQEIVVFLIVAGTLALSVRRFGSLVREHAAIERERANLARYFSPNVVDELAHNDDPLKQVRTQNVAVMFVDIVGFTHYAADRTPLEVIGTLRDFHGRMERQVFSHGGTLDKYLGDGLMATFGTPVASDRDALNALDCAKAMLGAMADWNAERSAAGEPPIRASFGIHYGPAVLGDIGANRLEFAVIGNTVNVASRVEALTRQLSVALAVTDDLLDRVREEAAREARDERTSGGFVRYDDQEIRGLDRRITVWGLA